MAIEVNGDIDEGARSGMLIHLFICGFLGLSINTLILHILIQKLRRRNAHVDIKLCAFVAATDIVVSLCLIFRSIFTKYPFNLIQYSQGWCKFDVLTGSQVLLFSGYTLGIMSIERFLLVCFNKQLPFVFWLVLIILTWIPQYIMASIGLADNIQVLVKTRVYCTVPPKGAGYGVFLFATVMFITSFLSVLVSYFGIMIVKYKQCLNQLNLNVPKEQVYSECRSTLTKSFLYISLFVLVFSGKIYSLGYELITGQKKTILMDLIATCLISCSAFINAVILLYMNQDVRKPFIEILVSIKKKVVNRQ